MFLELNARYPFFIYPSGLYFYFQLKKQTQIPVILIQSTRYRTQLQLVHPNEA